MKHGTNEPETPRAEGFEVRTDIPGMPEVLPDGRWRFTLKNCNYLGLNGDLTYPVELQFGAAEQTSPCFIVKADHYPELRAPHIVIQPDVAAKDPSKGWVPLGGDHHDMISLGTETTPSFRLGPDVEDEHVFIENDGFGHIGIEGLCDVVVTVAPLDIARYPDRSP